MIKSDNIDWQKSINNPVYSVDGKEISFVSSVQPDKIIITAGPLAPDKFLVPKSSITVYLKEDSSGTNPEEAAEKARKRGMTKGTAGSAKTGNEYEQGSAGTNQ